MLRLCSRELVLSDLLKERLLKLLHDIAVESLHSRRWDVPGLLEARGHSAFKDTHVDLVVSVLVALLAFQLQLGYIDDSDSLVLRLGLLIVRNQSHSIGTGWKSRNALSQIHAFLRGSKSSSILDDLASSRHLGIVVRLPFQNQVGGMLVDALVLWP